MKFTGAEKASIPLDQFSSVFTRESNGKVPTIGRRNESALSDLVIAAEIVLKELRNVNTSKSCGPDELHLRLLTEADIMAVPFTKRQFSQKLQPN